MGRLSFHDRSSNSNIFGDPMIILLIITIIVVLISFVLDYRKTILGLKKGYSMFMNIVFPFMKVLILVSIVLSIVSKNMIVAWLGGSSGVYGFIIAALVGSVSLIPGFIAFPLGSILLRMGVSYQVIAVFITTLMMVGIVTLPLEAKYFGWKTALMRNAFSFIGAVIVGIGIGVLWNHI
jgi:uncharacterized membrane protein YraQ (UPF0718 family)